MPVVSDSSVTMTLYFGDSIPVYLWEIISLLPPWKENIQLRPGPSESGIIQEWMCNPKWANQSE